MLNCDAGHWRVPVLVSADGAGCEVLSEPSGQVQHRVGAWCQSLSGVLCGCVSRGILLSLMFSEGAWRHVVTTFGCLTWRQRPLTVTGPPRCAPSDMNWMLRSCLQHCGEV